MWLLLVLVVSVVVVDVVEVVEEEEVAAAICASSSCSCCKALTNAALSRFVCSALSAFFTLVVTQFSQITRTSLPGGKSCCLTMELVPLNNYIGDRIKNTHLLQRKIVMHWKPDTRKPG